MKVGSTDSETSLSLLEDSGRTSWSNNTTLVCSTGCSPGLDILRSDSNKAAGFSDISIGLDGPLANNASRSSLILSVSEIGSAASDLEDSEVWRSSKSADLSDLEVGRSDSSADCSDLADLEVGRSGWSASSSDLEVGYSDSSADCSDLADLEVGRPGWSASLSDLEVGRSNSSADCSDLEVG